MLPALAAAAAISQSNINLDLISFGNRETLLAAAFHQEASVQDPQETNSQRLEESIDDLIRRASPISGVPERLKLEGRYTDVESRALVNQDHTYVLDPRPRFAALNVASYAASRDGRYIAVSQLVRVDQEEIVGGSVPTYRLDLSVLDRTTNKLTALRLPAQTIQSDLESPQAIEREMLNDIAFFSGADARGRLLVLLITRDGPNKSPRRVAWGASPDGNCIEIGPVGWKEEITLNPNLAIGIDYAVDKQSHKTQRTIFSPDRIIQRQTIDGEIFPFGWTDKGLAIEGSTAPGQPHQWWTLDLRNASLTSVPVSLRPQDMTPQGPLFGELALATEAGVLKFGPGTTGKTPNSASVRLDHEFETSTVLPPIGKVPLQVFGIVRDGSAFLTSVYDLSTKLFQARLIALKERDQIEQRAQELAEALKKIVADNNGLPAPKDLLSSLGAMGLTLDGFKPLYETSSGVKGDGPVAEMRGQHWVAFFRLNGAPQIERLSQ